MSIFRKSYLIEAAADGRLLLYREDGENGGALMSLEMPIVGIIEGERYLLRCGSGDEAVNVECRSRREMTEMQRDCFRALAGKRCGGLAKKAAIGMVALVAFVTISNSLTATVPVLVRGSAMPAGRTGQAASVQPDALALPDVVAKSDAPAEEIESCVADR